MKVILTNPKKKLRHIPRRPKGISERTYIKMFAYKKDETVQGHDFEFAMPSIDWLSEEYYALDDDVTLNKKIDMLFKEVITKPADVAELGTKAEVFGGGHNIPLITEVQKRINTFLKTPINTGDKTRSTPSSKV